MVEPWEHNEGCRCDWCDDPYWSEEASWDESGSDVPIWVVAVAMGALVFVLTLVALAVVVM